ncbi:MAG: glycosyltransferase family 39 protein, partial [Chloroflexota bacterium]
MPVWVRTWVDAVRERTGPWLILATSVSFLAFFLRILRLEDKDIWWDEGWSVWLARHDLSFIALRTASDEHPPLHYWLLSLWQPLAGESEFALRFSTVFFAVLTVALVIRMGATLSHRSVGLLAGLFLAASRFHVWWSQDIKMYALAIFVSLLSIYFFALCLRDRRLVLWVAYAVATAAALYALYLTFFVVVLENVAFLALCLLEREQQWRERLRRWVLVQCAVLLLVLPWLYLYHVHSIIFRRQTESLDLGLFLRLYATVLPLGISTGVENYAIPSLGFLIVVVVGFLFTFLRGRRSERVMALVVGLGLLLLPLGVFILSWVVEAIFHAKVAARYLILMIPLYSLSLGLGIRVLWQKRPILGILALLFILGCLGYTLAGYYAERYRTYHLPAMASYIAAHSEPDQAVVFYTDRRWP